MLTNIYLRVGKSKKGKVKIEASERPNEKPLRVGDKFIPTVSFGVSFNIPDNLFKKASTLIAIINVAEKEAKINAEIDSFK